MKTFDYQPGSTPLLMSVPHLGTKIPDEIASNMTEAGHQSPDTDWDLDRLYDFTRQLGIHVIAPYYSRYVIDLNRAPDGGELYPGASNTELVPTTTFYEQDIYLPNNLPDKAEIAQRRHAYWQPYHEQIQKSLGEIKQQFGIAVLFDCHSIRSHVPRFFSGRLPDFNLGTANGDSCDEGLRTTIAASLHPFREYQLALDGRFRGGYITRHYGNPSHNVHAFQMELSQATYANPEWPYQFDEELAKRVRQPLRTMLESVLQWVTS